jgi:hypothetical protein
MCTWGDCIELLICDRAINVDRCIASIVLALNVGGVATAMSCCGHGEGDGFIMLADGRILAVLPQSEFKARGFQTLAEKFDNVRLFGQEQEREG